LTETKINILVVDDLVDNLVLMESLLESELQTIFKAGSANEAILLLNEYEFALMLLDVQMPGMDGYELAEYVQTIELNKFTPIIFITAISRSFSNVNKGYISGAVDFISKPIEPEILLSKVNIFVNLYLQRLIIEEKNLQIAQQNLELQEKQKILAEAYRELETKNNDITDSIRYAKRIQQAILPHETDINIFFPQSFVFFKPKAIVSGDFFWIQQFPDSSHKIENHKDSYVFVALADCTGHGVPGAILSIVGSNLLNRAIKDSLLYDTKGILKEVDLQMLTWLNQTATSNIKDGMEMALLRFNSDSSEVQFSGARRPLILIREEHIVEYMGVKASIGHDDFKPHDFEYDSTLIKLQKGDTLYLFSDGYHDQFGGSNERKYSYKYFKELLLEIHLYPIENQLKILSNHLEEWMIGLEQIDDILIIGIKI